MHTCLQKVTCIVVCLHTKSIVGKHFHFYPIPWENSHTRIGFWEPISDISAQMKHERFYVGCYNLRYKYALSKLKFIVSL